MNKSKVSVLNKANKVLSSKNFIHLKTQGRYSILCLGLSTSSHELLVTYQSITNQRVWIRPAREFFDGRFEPFFPYSITEELILCALRILGLISSKQN